MGGDYDNELQMIHHLLLRAILVIPIAHLKSPDFCFLCLILTMVTFYTSYHF